MANQSGQGIGQPDPETPCEQRTLLLVEDEAPVGASKRKWLERAGYRVVVAGSGEQAVELAAGHADIDLVLMDIVLGEGIDGAEAARHILQSKDIPLLFLTAHTEPSYIDRTYGIASYGYVDKRSGDAVLLAAVAAALQLHARRQPDSQHEPAGERTMARAPAAAGGSARRREQALLSALPDLMFVLDREGRHIDYHAGDPASLFSQPEAFMNRSVTEFLPPEVAELWLQSLQQVLRNGETAVFEYSLEIAARQRHFEGRMVPCGADEALAVVRDVTEWKRVTDELRAESARFRQLFRDAPVAIALVGSDDCIVSANDIFLGMFGYELDEVRGRNIRDCIVPPEAQAEGEAIFRALFEAGERVYSETRRARKDGTLVEVALTCTPMYLDDGAYAYAMYQDIGERKRAEWALRESEAMFRSITESTSDIVLLLDLEGRFLYFNPEQPALVGVSPAELRERTAFDFVHPEDRERVMNAFREYVAGGGEMLEQTFRLLTGDGGFVWMDSRATLLRDEDARSTKVLVVSRNVTRYKEYEERIAALLRQKEILLKETHHRVKNHMGSIASYLAYQADDQHDEFVHRVLREAASRAQGMMVLYDQLYRAEQQQVLSIRDYLVPLLEKTVALLQPTDAVTAQAEIEDFELHSKLLAPLGMVITELVTNSIKHGFRDMGSGAITVSAYRRDEKAVVVYSDDGSGMRDGFESEDGGGFGLQLIDMLVEQIGGAYTSSGDDGVVYVIEFPLSG